MSSLDNRRKWAVRAARLIDGSGNPPIENAILVVAEDSIAAVGRASEVHVGPDVTVIDLDTDTVLPGLIDTHNHPTLKPIGTGTDASGYIKQFYDPEAVLATRAIRNLRIDLLGGATTVRVVGELAFVDVAMAKVIEEGLIPGPRVIPSGPRLAPTGGHVWIPEWFVDGPESIRRVIREYVSKGALLIKIGLLDEGPDKTSYSPEELEAVVGEAHAHDIPVAAHCTGQWGSSIVLSLRAGVDVVEHVTPLNDRMIEEFLKAKAAMSLTPFVYRLPLPQPAPYWQFQDSGARTAEEWMNYNAAISDDYLESHPEVLSEDRYFGKEVFPALGPWMEAVHSAWKAGIPLAVGSDAPHGILPLNVEFLVACGLSPVDAISAATSVAAKISRLDRLTGTLAVGMKADFVSVRGNPVSDIRALRKVHFVAREGIRFDGLSFD